MLLKLPWATSLLVAHLDNTGCSYLVSCVCVSANLGDPMYGYYVKCSHVFTHIFCILGMNDFDTGHLPLPSQTQ